jgi:SPP1 gp7 family putative phage head morphogenesis protein
MSSFAAHAKKRNRRSQLLARAPRISPTIEMQYIRDVRAVVSAFHAAIKRTVEPQQRMDSLWDTLAAKARAAAQAFRIVAAKTAERLQKFSKSEAVRTLGDMASDLDEDVTGFVADFAADAVTKIGALMTESLDAAREGQSVAEQQGAAFSVSDLLEGWLARAVNSASNQITQSSAELNQRRQEDMGITDYVWLAQHDGKTRPEHAALDGQECSYSDPPLSAEDSDIGEPCNPGDDYGCRCMASPIVRIVAEPASDDEQEEEAA